MIGGAVHAYADDHARNPCTRCGAPPGVDCPHDEPIPRRARRYRAEEVSRRAVRRLQVSVVLCVLWIMGTAANLAMPHWGWAVASVPLVVWSLHSTVLGRRELRRIGGTGGAGREIGEEEPMEQRARST